MILALGKLPPKSIYAADVVHTCNPSIKKQRQKDCNQLHSKTLSQTNHPFLFPPKNCKGPSKACKAPELPGKDTTFLRFFTSSLASGEGGSDTTVLYPELLYLSQCPSLSFTDTSQKSVLPCKTIFGFSSLCSRMDTVFLGYHP